jgi:hypothetical protein
MKRRYWTPERDAELKRHEAAGLSTAEIAALLGTTKSAIIGRSNRLRGNLFKSDAKRWERQRIPVAQKRAEAALFAAVRADIAAGINRDVMVKRALAAGIGRAAIEELIGLSFGEVYQIAGPRPLAATRRA